MIRVFVVDDSSFVRKALTKVLSADPEIRVVGEARSAEEALHRVKKHGGAVASEIHVIPAGRFAYCRDPDGTRFGLFTAG